jgi:hypothetical protein
MNGCLILARVPLLDHGPDEVLILGFDGPLQGLSPPLSQVVRIAAVDDNLDIQSHATKLRGPEPV